MANQLIVNELQTPAAHGINSVIKAYQNPGGATKDSALAAIEANTDLFNEQNISVYRKSIQPTEFFTALTSGALTALGANERADYSAFITPMLNSSVSSPETLLKSLVDSIFSGVGENQTVRTNYDSLIQEQTSVAGILGITVRASDVEQAMFELGWIV